MNLNAVNRSVTLLSRMIDPTKPTQSFLPPTAGKPLFSETPTPYFARVMPEDVGVSSGAVSSFLRALHENPELNMHGITLLRHGKIFCETPFGAQDVRIPKYTFSACKSIVSLCIGILTGDGCLSLDDKITDLFSDRITPVSKITLGTLCIRDLLTMRSAVMFNELESLTEPDWIKGFLNSALQGKNGTAFSYNSLNTYMLAAVICRKTGMSLSAFAAKRLFAPLSITDYFWETCPRGIEKGGWGLYIRQEDLAKLGLLVLQNGRWNDSYNVSHRASNVTRSQVCNDIHLVPESYIRDAVTQHAKVPLACGAFNYGYQIWVSRDTAHPVYLFNGVLGQNVMIFPETDTVLVSNAGNGEFYQTSPFYAIATEYFAAKTARVFPEENADPASYRSQMMQTKLRYTQTELRYHTAAQLRAIRLRAEELECEASPKHPPKQPETAPPKSVFAGLAALFRGENPAMKPHTNPTPAKMQVTQTTANAPRVVLPENAKQFLDRTFLYSPLYAARTGDAPLSFFLKPSDTTKPSEQKPAETKQPEPAAAENPVGLLPAILQAVQNAYTQGFSSLSFSKIITDGNEQMLVTYREQEDTHIFIAGYGESVRSTCTFRGIPFRIAASCRFTTDECDRPVCILNVDFLETPCSRIIKVFLNPTPHAQGLPDAVLKQEETPGGAMVLQVILDQKDQLATQPIIGGALDKIDNFYLDYRVRRKLSPELGLRVKE